MAKGVKSRPTTLHREGFCKNQAEPFASWAVKFAPWTSIHKQGLSRRFLVREEDKTSTFDKPKVEYDLGNFVPLECPAGSLVLLHGYGHSSV
eukprot:scaffold125001_cov23-Tisochrysis_lutea.AAC.2